MSSNIVDIVIASQDALIARDLDRYLSLCAADVVAEDPSAPRIEGRDGLRKLMEGLLGAFPEIAFVDRKVFPLGRRAALRFTLRVITHDGREAMLDGVDVFEFNEQNQIVHIASYYDPAAIAAVLSPPGP